jgi:hypothetical protein
MEMQYAKSGQVVDSSQQIVFAEIDRFSFVLGIKHFAFELVGEMFGILDPCPGRVGMSHQGGRSSNCASRLLKNSPLDDG